LLRHEGPSRNTERFAFIRVIRVTNGSKPTPARRSQPADSRLRREWL